jgi:beta-D-galactosyl-(1->4)-L-rhamnose phosphorylase
VCSSDLIDIDDGRRLCHGVWKVDPSNTGLEQFSLAKKEGVYLLDGSTEVLQAKEAVPVFTQRSFGRGKGLYLSEYRYSPQNTFALRSLLEQTVGKTSAFSSNNPFVDCAYFPAAKTLVLANGSTEVQTVVVSMGNETRTEQVEGFGMKVIKL